MLKSAPGGGLGVGRPGGGGGRGGFAALRALSDAAAIVMVTDALSPAAVQAATHPREGDVMMKPTGNAPGGQLTITTDVENYPGFADTIQGPWLMEQMRAQAKHVGTELVEDIIVKAELNVRPFRLTGDSGQVYLADSVIIATGAQAKWLGLDTEHKF